jgi:hypothetical protein
VALDIGELPLLPRRLEVKLKLRVEHVPVVAQYPAQGRQLAVYHPPLEVVPRPQLFEPLLLFLPARSFRSTFPHAFMDAFPERVHTAVFTVRYELHFAAFELSFQT